MHQSSGGMAAKKCSPGLEEGKMSWREQQEGESGESGGGGRGAPRSESASGEGKDEA